ncbi:unnamed protein product [Vicia faba]|uniref:Uncharacterized protein n=1 Tax=Vicia faba TaxID=3906 RepID=A0AAV0YP70_VICFA|nr:unnamed protein product [Vicia faba]
MVNNVSANIDDVVNDYVSVEDGSTPKNNEVHDGFAPINEGVIKYVDISKRYDKKSNKMNNLILKDGNEDVNHDVPNNLYDMLVTDFPTQRKDEKVSLVNSYVNKNLFQIGDYDINDEEDFLDMVSIIRRKKKARFPLLIILTKKMEANEEEETASEDEEEHYIESLKYNEIMELLSDAQLLKKMLNVEACYPKLMLKFMVKNDDVSHGC